MVAASHADRLVTFNTVNCAGLEPGLSPWQPWQFFFFSRISGEKDLVGIFFHCKKFPREIFFPNCKYSRATKLSYCVFRRIEWLIGLIKNDLLIERVKVKIVKRGQDFSYFSIYLFIFFPNFRFIGEILNLERKLKGD